jgi:hypothetical protein
MNLEIRQQIVGLLMPLGEWALHALNIGSSRRGVAVSIASITSRPTAARPIHVGRDTRSGFNTISISACHP